MTRPRRYLQRGQPRRAGDQPIVRVEVKFGESEIAEVDRARGSVCRADVIRDAVLAWARGQPNR